MSNYVYNPDKSYTEYLQQNQFVDDIKKTVKLEISSQTKQLLASNLAIEDLGAQVSSGLQHQIEVTQQGFETISYQMQDLISATTNLQASFDWGFSSILTSLGHINDSLKTLITIATTPVQTTAYNHFEIARDAFRRRLYQEALLEVDKAINGVTGVSAGYTIEWRFYQLIGIIRMGFNGCDVSLVDLQKAETAFVTAAKYAETYYPDEAARSYLYAARSTYLQGYYQKALDYLKKSLQLNNKLGESIFLSAKIYSAVNKLEISYDFLKKAIKLNDLYALKAAGDGDFQKHNNDFNQFIKQLTDEYYYPIEIELKKLKSDFSEILVDIESLSQYVTELRALLDYKESMRRLADLKRITTKYKTDFLKIGKFIDNSKSQKLGYEYNRIVKICIDDFKISIRKIGYFETVNSISVLYNKKTLNGMASALTLYENLSNEVQKQMETAKKEIHKVFDISRDIKSKDSTDQTFHGVSGLVLSIAAFVSLLPLLGLIIAWIIIGLGSLFDIYNPWLHEFAADCGRIVLYSVLFSAVAIGFTWIIGNIRKNSLDNIIQDKNQNMHRIIDDIDGLVSNMKV